MSINYDDFNWKFYIKVNSDLIHIKTKIDAFNHFIKIGKFENRIYKEDKNINIDEKFYKFLYDDLSDIDNNGDLIKHYYLYGKKEDRIINRSDNRYKLFHWKYYLDNNTDIIINKIFDKLLKDYTFKHYITHGIKEDRVIYNFSDFDCIFYKNYYNLKYNNENEIKIHYLENLDNIFINSNIYNNYKLFDCNKYKKYYNLSEIILDEDLFKHYLINYKNGNIFFKKNLSLDKTNPKIGIAVSIYIDKNTPNERVLCSKICINSILKECDSVYIIFIIDNCITIDYLKFLFDVIDNRDNIKVYINKKNFGIAKTKNICMKLLEELNLDYICLLDDDVEIKVNFCNYIENIFNKVSDIPFLSNFNFELPYSKIKHNDIEFIKTNNYFGNFLVFNQKFIEKYGYMRIFNYKWGHEHIDITHRYLNNTKYKDYAIDLSYYINNFQIINSKNTLHLHSCYVDHEKVIDNKNILDKYLNNIEYVPFILDKTDIKEITYLELDKINYINKKINKYNKITEKYLKDSKYLKESYWNKIDNFFDIFYNNINKDYEEYNKNYNIINKILNKLNDYNINNDLKEKILKDIEFIKNNYENDKLDKELFSVTLVKEDTINLLNESKDKELFSEILVKENTINLLNESKDKELFSEILVKEDTINLLNESKDKELFSEILVKENTINLLNESKDKELFSEILVKENTINLLNESIDKELFSVTLVKEDTINLSNDSIDKELFSVTLVKEDTINLSNDSIDKKILSEI
jgi:hypothetical protein